MQKVILLVMVTGLIGCSNDDDYGIDCALFDPAFPTLFIRLIDSSGANLIENGTINPDDISVVGDFTGAWFQLIPANELANPDSEIRELDNTIRISIPNESTFQYTISLSSTEDIRIDFSAEVTEIPCDLFYFTPIEGVVNGVTLELRELSSLQFLATIEL